MAFAPPEAQGATYALLTKISMSLHSSGRLPTKLLTSSGLLTSSLYGSTLTPSPTSFWICAATSFNVSIRRAVRISRRFLGDVRANSTAVLLPIPEEAPVMTIVLPSRRLPIAVVAMVRMSGRVGVRARVSAVRVRMNCRDLYTNGIYT